MATRLALRIAGSSSVVDGTSDRLVDVWTSDYTSRAAAIADAALPKYNTEHPNNPGLFVDSYRFVPVEDGRFDIEVNYSNDGSYRLFENPRPNTEDGARLQFGVKQVTVKIPAFAIANKSLSQGSSQVGSVKVWEPISLSYEEYRAMVSYRVVVPTITLANVNAMSEQIHKIHTLAGVKFEMMPWSQNPHSRTEDEVTYYWVRDMGTIDPRTLPGWNQAQAARISIPPVIPNTAPALIRLPYTNIVAIPGIDAYDAQQNPFPPDYFTVPFAVENPNGWMSLPGLT